ncbi:hypothetical protein GGX14DRAFT_397996 [Mycena pura]|uniref:Uncharacterized protein n=1 Tax=Mycena pura TaxID=153505 RepID=A0AAD6V7V0_9AGAR|nr:hypothetical protein GGX14DRAFT_397996 [Mycena pura]
MPWGDPGQLKWCRKTTVQNRVGEARQKRCKLRHCAALRRRECEKKEKRWINRSTRANFADPSQEIWKSALVMPPLVDDRVYEFGSNPKNAAVGSRDPRQVSANIFPPSSSQLPDSDMSDQSQQNAILVSFGNSLYHDVVTFSIGFILYGLYLLVFPVCLWFILNLRPLPRASTVLLAATILAFTATTVQFTVEMTWLLEQIRIYLIRADIPLSDRRAYWSQRFTALTVIDYWPQLVTVGTITFLVRFHTNGGPKYTVSDAIVAWRAWVLYPRNRFVQGTLATVVCADLVLWIYAQANLSKHRAQDIAISPGTDVNLSTAANFLSLGTNLLSTGFIAVKAWKYFQLLDGTWRDKIRRSRATQILLVLVETGVVWAVVQIVVGVIQQLDVEAFTRLDLATSVIETASTYLAAILPAATIIIVRSQNSFESWTITNPTDVRNIQKKSTLRFGVSGAMRSTDADSVNSSAVPGEAQQQSMPPKVTDHEKVG